ncbi:MAG TPA: alpha/beta fold hydrolase [Gemmatimonas sp.]|uniref:alpha/beta hydrolase n=1 Tax=Gemmatimonas sp. TaxID=1962908 RepID=UPI002ED92AFC
MHNTTLHNTRPFFVALVLRARRRLLAGFALTASMACPPTHIEAQAQLAAPAAAHIRFEPHPFVTRAHGTIDAELGTLDVPRRHDQPSGPRQTLRLVRLRARHPVAGAAPVIYLAGGPGGSGIDAARGNRWPVFDSVRQHVDVILLDQRGTGQSAPPAPCPRSSTAPLRNDSLMSQARQIEAVRRETARCVAWWKTQGVDLAAYTTVQSAQDIDVLRQALGVPQVSLWGMSYGTHLALATLRHAPHAVQRIVLMGTEGPDHTFKDPRDADRILQRLATWAAKDSVARTLTPDLTQALRDALRSLQARPLTGVVQGPPGVGGPMVIGPFDLQLAVAGALGRTQTASLVPVMLSMVQQGDASLVAQLVSGIREAVLRPSAMSLAMDLASGATGARRAMVAAGERESVFGGALNFPWTTLDAAAFGVPDLGDAFRAPIRSDVPALFVSGTMDGRTPPMNADEVRRGFSNAHTLLLDGAGHDDDLWTSSPQVAGTLGRLFGGQAIASQTVMTPLLRIPARPSAGPSMPRPPAPPSASPVSRGDRVATALLDRAIARMGGDSLLAAITSMRMDLLTQWQRTTFSEHPYPDQPSFERNSDLRNYALNAWRNARMPLTGGMFLDIVRDTVAARSFNGPGGATTTMPLNIAYITERREQFAFAPERTLRLARHAADLRALRDSTIDGVVHARVAATVDGFPSVWFLRRTDGLPAFVRFMADETNDFGLASWGVMPVEIWFSNWTKVPPGVLLPRQRDVRRVGRPYKRMTALAFTVNASAPADSFAISDSMALRYLATERRPMWQLSFDSVRVNAEHFVSWPQLVGSAGAVKIGGGWVLFETAQSEGSLPAIDAWLTRHTGVGLVAGVAARPGAGNGGARWFARTGRGLHVAPGTQAIVRSILYSDTSARGSKRAPRTSMMVAQTPRWARIGNDSLWLEAIDLPDAPGVLVAYSPTHRWIYSPMLGVPNYAPEYDVLLTRWRARGWVIEWQGSLRALRAPI